MNNLKDHFTAILEACKNCAEVGEVDDPISTGLCYEEDNIRIELSFLASGRYCCDGDGFSAPREQYLSNVHISVEEISGEYITNDEKEEIPDSELNELTDYIEKELPSLLED